MISIREATDRDRRDVRAVHRRAFPAHERQPVAALAVGLLGEDTTPGTFALVAETGGAVVGHIAFSPVEIESARTGTGYILAPLGVVPGWQRQGVGAKLIEGGKQRLMDRGVNLLFVYGDPGYYRRFGFNAETAAGYRPPYELQYPFGWQAVILEECARPASPCRISCVEPLRDPELW